MTPLSDLLLELPACRVVEAARLVDQHGVPIPGDPGQDQRYAALVAAYHTRTTKPVPVVTGWWRANRHGPVELFAAGTTIATVGVDGHASLTIPTGGRGIGLAPGGLSGRLMALPHWVRLAGVPDGLLLDDPPTRTEVPRRPSMEDCLLRAWHEPFGWLLVAQPVEREELDRLARAIADEERAARARSSADYAVLADRLLRRHRELRQAESSGLWSVHLLAGATSVATATAVAGLVAASIDLAGLPYRLAPAPAGNGLGETLDTTTDQSPFLASSRLVAAITVVPREEIPGLRLTTPPDFDVTPEISPATGPAIRIGQVLDHNRWPVDDLHAPLTSLNRHTFVCGATGAGKSQTIRHLLEQASLVGVPWLVIEPAKAEYRRMAARLGPATVTAIRPGDPDGIPVGLNPLEPVASFPLQTHLDLTRALFLAAFEADEPFPQILAAALTRCYEELGWDLTLGEAAVAGHLPRHPTLGDLQRAAEQVVAGIGYGREVADNVRGFIRVRLSSLRLGTTGRFFEGGHPVDFGRLLTGNVVFEIEDVGDDQDKAFLMGTVLVRLVEHLRMAARGPADPGGDGLRHLTVIEEAHRLLRRTDRPGPAAHAVELFAALLAEVRSYGEGLVIAEQIPRKLVPDVIKNTAVKIIHRLPARDDRDVVGATCNLSERQSQYLVTLTPGAGAVFADGMDRPILVQAPDGTDREERQTSLPQLRAVSDLVRSRSVLCGPDCRSRPCTLRQIRAAQQMTGQATWVVLWAELAVLGHLTGWGAPLPRRRMLEQLARLPARLRDCALAHTIDHAVATRSAVLGPAAGPEPLSRHVSDAMRGMFQRVLGCAPEEPRWLARPYRWVLVLDELAAAARSEPDGGPHPRTREWNHQHGRPLPLVPRAEQLAMVRRWFEADTRDQAAVRAVAFGADPQSALETAVGARRDDADWSRRLPEQLETFHKCRWPLRYLAPGATRSEDSHGD